MILDAFHKKIILTQLRQKYWDTLGERQKIRFLEAINGENFEDTLTFHDGENPYVQIWTWNTLSQFIVSAGVFHKDITEFEVLFEKLKKNIRRAQDEETFEHMKHNPLEDDENEYT